MQRTPRLSAASEREGSLVFTWKKHVDIRDYPTDSDSPSAAESKEGPEPYRSDHALPDTYGGYYWAIRKIILFIKMGDQQACVAALNMLSSFDYTDAMNAIAFVDSKGLEVLINLMEVNEYECRIGALNVAKNITKDPKIATETVYLGLPDVLARRLLDYQDIASLSAKTICSLGKLRRASRAFRKNNTLRLLTNLCDIPAILFFLPEENMKEEEKDTLEAAENALYALWTLARFTKNKYVLSKVGLLPLIVNIFMSGNKRLLPPVLGILADISTQLDIQAAVENKGLIVGLIDYLQTSTFNLQRHCSIVLEHMADKRPIVRELIRLNRGHEVMLQIANECHGQSSKRPLLVSCVGAMWKSAKTRENSKHLYQLGVLQFALTLLTAFDEDQCIVSSGLIAEMSQLSCVERDIVALGGIPLLANLLGRPNEGMVCNILETIGKCAKHPEARSALEECEVLRRALSMLRDRHGSIKVKALFALRNLLKFLPDTAELIRSLQGALQIVVEALDSDDLEVISLACSVISQMALAQRGIHVLTLRHSHAITSRHWVARDHENLGVLTEEGVTTRLVRALRRRTKARMDAVEVAKAIARCCAWGDNAEQFGLLGAIPGIVHLLKSADRRQFRQACQALCALSTVPLNCAFIHTFRVVPILLGIGDEDHRTQRAAVCCLYNMRTVALEAEKRKMRMPRGQPPTHISEGPF